MLDEEEGQVRVRDLWKREDGRDHLVRRRVAGRDWKKKTRPEQEEPDFRPFDQSQWEEDLLLVVVVVERLLRLLQWWLLLLLGDRRK